MQCVDIFKRLDRKSLSYYAFFSLTAIISSLVNGVVKTRNGNGTERKAVWNGKRNKNSKGNQNIKIPLIQLLWKEFVFKQRKNFCFKFHFKPTVGFNILTSLELTILRFSKGSIKEKPFVIWYMKTTLVNIGKKRI